MWIWIWTRPGIRWTVSWDNFLRSWVPALQGREVGFTVSYVAVLPDFATWRTTRGSQGFDARTFEVRARPEQPIAGARPGMSVLVEGGK
jgi:HlyD family secretion protein